MPAKGKESASSSDYVNPNIRASTSSMKDSKLDQIISMMKAEFAGVLGELAQQKQQIAELQAAQIAPAPAPTATQAPTIVPVVTPATEPFTKSTPFRADEVGHFDPDLNADGDMVTIGKDL